MKAANDDCVTKEMVQKGFKVTDWFPLDKNAVDFKTCILEASKVQVRDEADGAEEADDEFTLEVKKMQAKLAEMKQKVQKLNKH
jgi:hypothetical protein